jgi:hypothetical protein
MSRDFTIRKMNGVQHLRPSLDYPYRYIQEDEYGYDYTVKDIRRPIMTDIEEAEVGNFPSNIQEHFWIRPGRNDGDSWMACGRLTNGNYFFFTGGCDYTGFDCQGSMSLWVSSSWKNIVEQGMSRGNYELYLKQTAVPPAEGEEPWPVLTADEFWAEIRRHIRCYECGEEGATVEMPYMDREMLCERCYESYQNDRGSRWEEELTAE